MPLHKSRHELSVPCKRDWCFFFEYFCSRWRRIRTLELLTRTNLIWKRKQEFYWIRWRKKERIEVCIIKAEVRSPFVLQVSSKREWALLLWADEITKLPTSNIKPKENEGEKDESWAGFASVIVDAMKGGFTVCNVLSSKMCSSSLRHLLADILRRGQFQYCWRPFALHPAVRQCKRKEKLNVLLCMFKMECKQN